MGGLGLLLALGLPALRKYAGCNNMAIGTSCFRDAEPDLFFIDWILVISTIILFGIAHDLRDVARGLGNALRGIAAAVFWCLTPVFWFLSLVWWCIWRIVWIPSFLADISTYIVLGVTNYFTGWEWEIPIITAWRNEAALVARRECDADKSFAAMAILTPFKAMASMLYLCLVPLGVFLGVCLGVFVGTLKLLWSFMSALAEQIEINNAWGVFQDQHGRTYYYNSK